MIQKYKTRISIVIPVYNEAERLAACLDAIRNQTEQPYEVLVVDNNSTDATAAVARRYPFVTLIYEPLQGVIHARTTGFDRARGEIIARIDADTMLPPTWLAQAAAIMADTSVAAVSGAPHYYDFALPALANRIDWYWRQRLADKLGNMNFLYGANMAFRRSAWLVVRSKLCTQAGMHEDFDLAIHLQQLGMQVAYDASLVAGVSSRRLDTSFAAYMRYTLVSPRTYALHRLRSRRHMYPVLMICWLCHAPGRLLMRLYDPHTQRFTLTNVFTTPVPRVDPTAHVV